MWYENVELDKYPKDVMLLPTQDIPMEHIELINELNREEREKLKEEDGTLINQKFMVKTTKLECQYLLKGMQLLSCFALFSYIFLYMCERKYLKQMDIGYKVLKHLQGLKPSWEHLVKLNKELYSLNKWIAYINILYYVITGFQGINSSFMIATYIYEQSLNPKIINDKSMIEQRYLRLMAKLRLLQKYLNEHQSSDVQKSYGKLIDFLHLKIDSRVVRNL